MYLLSFYNILLYILVKSSSRSNAFTVFLITKPRKNTSFELRFKPRCPLLLLQVHGIGDKNHSTVTGFFKSTKTWF